MKQWFFFNYFNIVFTLSSTLLNAEDPFSRLGSLFKTFPPVSSKSCSIGCVQFRKPFTLPFSNVSLLKDSLFVSAWLESGKNAVRLEKISWIWSHHLHFKGKFKLLAGKFIWGWAASTNFLFSKVPSQHTAIICLYTSSRLSRQ